MTVTAPQQAIASGGPRPAPGTLNQLFFAAVERHASPNAFRVKGGGPSGPFSHRVLAGRVRRVALGLQGLGMGRGHRVSFRSENLPEWAIADYACLTAGFVDVPLYPTLPA